MGGVVMAGPAYGTNVGQDFTFLTDSDFSTNQFYFVELGSDLYLNIISTAGKRALGVLQDNNVGTASQPIGCEVRTAGTSKVQAGGTFAAGDLLTTDATGKAVKYTGATVFTGTPYTVSGSQVLGIALAAGTSGQLTTILFQPSGLCAAGD